METLIVLKTVHILATVLLLGSALGLAIWVWRARSKGDASIYSRLLRRPLVFVWLLLVICLASLPFSGWWLVHLLGWSLGQTWILASSVIYTVGALSCFWLLARLNRLRIASGVGSPKFTLALAVFSFVCFFAIAGLMGAKPV
ncbi:DUF2269 family protein [Pseudomonas chlororaphis]|uniref:DUF2269 family protein n=1 Tax=Pseudomonas chlororaphis TaxID=587753 RepID=UPI002368B93F|nr:DUF2269 family protein [Pseudomonas chlororaphis]WDH35113.1 DUF2269 family protein [Pseudomonas chlororaphis]WDH41198.1 DUF2269 family protein [Pseudomonas chlororaphis]